MTMTDAELAEIRARAEAAANHSRVDAEQQELLEYDIPALLDELAAARKVIATIVTGATRRQPGRYDICQIDYDAARAYLHSTEDAGATGEGA